MELPSHSMKTLFEQLGLASTEQAIEEFIDTHQLAEGSLIEDASFWSDGQRQFLVEERREDADWAIWVDELDALLHREAM